METMKTIVVGEVMLDHMVQGEWCRREWDEGPYHDSFNMPKYYHYDSSWCENRFSFCVIV